MKARAVIIGGGVQGLSLAYRLAQNGWTDVIVCEKSHLNSGASARNGGGIRAQWSTSANIEIMLEALHLFETFSSRLGTNIWFRQDGYIFIAKSNEQAESFVNNVALQNEHGIPSRILSPRDIKAMVPQINMNGIVAGAFHQKDGVLFPFPVLWGYARAAKSLGVRILTFTEVTDIKTKSGKIEKVITDKGDIETSIVVNATASWAPEIGKMVGVSLPNKAEKHEAIVTEPLHPFLGPNLVPMDCGMYVTQTMRGEIFACGGHPTENIDYDATFGFIRYISGLLIDLLPVTGEIKLLRQWAGYYDITPDTNPILGPVKELEGFIQLHGFMGHGFMMAPVMARIMADYLTKDTPHPIIEKCSLSRFEGELLEAETMIIG